MAKAKKKRFGWVRPLAIVFLIVWFVRLFFLTPIAVDGPSMAPTLQDQDHLIIEKLSYQFTSPKRFDVIVFQATEEKQYIKRIIGLPGEQVEIRNDQLYINQVFIPEPFIAQTVQELEGEGKYTYDFSLSDLPGSYTVIPEDHYLVLGDNRRNSTDSRYLGLIHEDDILGRASLIYWPINRIGKVN
ncbi:signal peptidase I [Amphibacillus sediminis]|uniref:signal peptidase I n=1 Tax=Amphibacillus sediminis TaxID=360185 RepID=UPI000830DB7B|nr:signal peptidase I [Amphibacillus sediminis]